MLTEEQFYAVLPDKMKKTLNPTVIASINQIIGNPDMHEEYRENLLSYTNVMKEGRFKLLDYVYAVKFVSHRLRGDNQQESYIKTFPDKYQDFLNRGVSKKDISSYITAYSKNKLVNLIFEQTLVPTHVLNQDKYQEALNVLTTLMLDAKSEKVRADSAKALLDHLKPPTTHKLELDIGVKENSTLDELRKATMELVAQQKMMIASGIADAKDVAEYRVIEAKEVSN